MMDQQRNRRSVISVLRLLAPAATIGGTLCLYYGLDNLLRNVQAGSGQDAHAVLAAWITGGFVLLAAGLLATGAAYLGPLLAGGERVRGPVEPSGIIGSGEGPMYDPSSPAEVLARISQMASPEAADEPPVPQRPRGFQASEWEGEDEFTKAAAEAYGRVFTPSSQCEADAAKEHSAPAGAGGSSSRAPTDSQAVPCPRCQFDNPPGTRFCRQCGALLVEPVACVACGDFNDKGARVCGSCGKELA